MEDVQDNPKEGDRVGRRPAINTKMHFSFNLLILVERSVSISYKIKLERQFSP